MDTITIPKSEYCKLVSRAKAYERLAGSIFENAVKDPVKDIVMDFKIRTSLQMNFSKTLRAA